ncbi:uncharacterized protein [Arachis hypogaea]|uniref:uncharacterized protein n=1 Tax=Arachis hypogaea TaxID=3818 RepID=UPI0007AF7960|nr:uncharacterized protein LOC112730366 [Arachis hypogaea]
MTWVVELSQYDLQYEPKHMIKAQTMADFLVEVTGDPVGTLNTRWKLHIDGASNQIFGGARIILENPIGLVYEQSIKFELPVSNNQAEYEALLGGLALAREVRATRLEICSDLQKYLEKIKELSKQFEEVTVQHVPRERNTRADLLSKLASTKPETGNRSLIQGLIKEPAVALHLTQADPSWMSPIIDFLERAKLPSDEKVAKTIRQEAAKYAIIQGQLFKKGLSKPLLKCLRPDQTDYVLREVHEGCCSHHIGGKALARKLIRAGYYWPSIMADSKEFWGIDLLGPFPARPGQRQVIARFGIPDVIISDNGTQFADKRFGEFLAGLGIQQKFSSVEHPQTNGQVKAANKVILQGLKKRLDQQKGAWADELVSVLWVDTIIPVEISEPSPRLLLGGVEEAMEKDLVDEAREMAHLSETALKQRMALHYNAKVLKKEFRQSDLVLRRNDVGLPTPGKGKLAANWEGPYRVKEVLGNGAYRLEQLDSKEIPRTWNAINLRRFYP